MPVVFYAPKPVVVKIARLFDSLSLEIHVESGGFQRAICVCCGGIEEKTTVSCSVSR